MACDPPFRFRSADERLSKQSHVHDRDTIKEKGGKRPPSERKPDAGKTISRASQSDVHRKLANQSIVTQENPLIDP
jgi:hypothetical protein